MPHEFEYLGRICYSLKFWAFSFWMKIDLLYQRNMGVSHIEEQQKKIWVSLYGVLFCYNLRIIGQGFFLMHVCAGLDANQDKNVYELNAYVYELNAWSVWRIEAKFLSLGFSDFRFSTELFFLIIQRKHLEKLAVMWLVSVGCQCVYLFIWINLPYYISDVIGFRIENDCPLILTIFQYRCDVTGFGGGEWPFIWIWTWECWQITSSLKKHTKIVLHNFCHQPHCWS